MKKWLLMLMMLMGAVEGYAKDTDCPTDNVQCFTYDSFFLEAMMQRQKGNNDATFDLLNLCIDIDSTRSEAYYYLAQYFGALKKRETEEKKQWENDWNHIIREYENMLRDYIAKDFENNSENKTFSKIFFTSPIND